MATRAQRALEDLDVPEGFRAELINGEIILSPSGKKLHWNIQRNLIRQFDPLGWEFATDQTLTHAEHEHLPQPDFLLVRAEDDPEIDDDGYYPAEKIQLVAEVLSKSNRGTDLIDKVEVYATFGIPLYLIIDPFKGECILHRDPTKAIYTPLNGTPPGRGYSTKEVFEFGTPVPLPDPVDVTLDTSGFGRYRT